MRIEPFTAHWVPAVRAFNARLAAGGSVWRFPDTPVPEWLPPAPDSTVFQEFFVLLEGEHVRGAYILKHRDIAVGDGMRRAGTIELPLSEGVVDRAYAMVAYHLLNDALRRQPLLFGVGMGGDEVRIARVLRAMQWRLRPVAFCFKVIDGTRFCRHLRHLRTTWLRSRLLDVAAASGMGWVAAKAANAVLDRRLRAHTGTTVEAVEWFGDWADDLWESCRRRYAFVGGRDRDALNRIYASTNPHLVRLRIAGPAGVIGWAVVEDRQLSADEHFGDLRVGTIMDGLAAPEDAEAAVGHATRALTARDVDVIVSNQTHPAWIAGLRRAGFLPGPSNFLLGTAPALTALLERIDPEDRNLHLNRGDGPGPWGVTFRAGSDQTESGLQSAECRSQNECRS